MPDSTQLAAAFLSAGGGVGAGRGSSIFNRLTEPQQQAFAGALGRDPSLQYSLNGQLLGGRGPTGFEQSFQQQQFDTGQENRAQILQLLGLSPETLGSGGLLGSNFFGSVLNNTLPNVVGGVTSNLPGGSGGRLGSPGFADSPENPGSPGGGSGGNLFGGIGGGGGSGGGLFDQLLNARGSFGRDILSDISGLGGSQRARINEDYQNLGNSALARLDARGLGSSNLGAATMQGNEKGRQRALGELEDSLLQQQVGAKMGLAEGLFGDVGSEMDRGVQRQGLAVQQQGNMMDLLSSIFGSALNVV